MEKRFNSNIFNLYYFFIKQLTNENLYSIMLTVVNIMRFKINQYKGRRKNDFKITRRIFKNNLYN